MQNRSDYEKCNAIRKILCDPDVFTPGQEYSRREIMAMLRKRNALALDEDVISMPVILKKMGWSKNKNNGGKGMPWTCPNQKREEAPEPEASPVLEALTDVKDDTRDIRAFVRDIRNLGIENQEILTAHTKWLSEIESHIQKLGKQFAAFCEQMGAKV